MTTLVRLEIEADNINFVTHIAIGKIISVHIKSFEG